MLKIDVGYANRRESKVNILAHRLCPLPLA